VSRPMLAGARRPGEGIVPEGGNAFKPGSDGLLTGWISYASDG
jgi:hypothetical protein